MMGLINAKVMIYKLKQAIMGIPILFLSATITTLKFFFCISLYVLGHLNDVWNLKHLK